MTSEKTFPLGNFPFELRLSFYSAIIDILGLAEVDIWHDASLAIARARESRSKERKLSGQPPSTTLEQYVNRLAQNRNGIWFEHNAVVDKKVKSGLELCRGRAYIRKELQQFTDACLVCREWYTCLTKLFYRGACMRVSWCYDDLRLPGQLGHGRELSWADPDLSRKVLLDNQSFGSCLKRLTIHFAGNTTSDFSMFSGGYRSFYQRQLNLTPNPAFPHEYWTEERWRHTINHLFDGMPNLESVDIQIDYPPLEDKLEEAGFPRVVKQRLAERRSKLKSAAMRCGRGRCTFYQWPEPADKSTETPEAHLEGENTE